MDEDDVVQQVFADFFTQVKQGRFPQLCDRDDLWQILAMLVCRKSTDQIRRQNTLRAGERRVIGQFSCKNQDNTASSDGDLLLSVPARDPTPAEAMEVVETVQNRLALLSDATWREIALLKLQGYSNNEIAKKLRSSLRTVERTLNRIRKIWQVDASA